MPAMERTAQEIADLGEKIYHDHIKPSIELEEEKGKFVVIDVDSGDYEIDKRDALASQRLLERRPGAIIYGVRVGFPTAYRMVSKKSPRSTK